MDREIEDKFICDECGMVYTKEEEECREMAGKVMCSSCYHIEVEYKRGLRRAEGIDW